MRASLLVLLLLVGCKHPQGTESESAVPAVTATTAARTPGVLGSGDVVEVRVFGESDFSGLHRITASGHIDYPFCGRLAATGRTPSELGEAIATCLRAGLLRQPQVTVSLREYNSRKIFVLGEVQKPGTFPYEDGMTVVQALSLAGGFTKLAAKNACNLTRTEEGRERRYALRVEEIALGRAPNVVLQPGDILFIPESFF